MKTVILARRQLGRPKQPCPGYRFGKMRRSRMYRPSAAGQKAYELRLVNDVPYIIVCKQPLEAGYGARPG